MRRIPLNRRTLVVLAVMVATALVAALFPLTASAGCGSGGCGW